MAKKEDGGLKKSAQPRKAGTAKRKTSGKGAAKGDVIAAALALAAEHSWREVTLQQIAKKAGLPLSGLVEDYPTKTAIVRAFMRRIDRQVLDGIDADLADEPARERLLDVMISRFEALAPYKDAVRSIAGAVRRDADAALTLNASAVRSQYAMMAAAGIDTDGVSGAARAQALAVIFARALRTWLRDDDPGMARTMAELDRRLRDGEKIIRRVAGVGAVGRLAADFCRAVLDRGRRRRDPRPEA